MSVSFVTPLNLVFLLSLLFALALIVYGFVRRQKVAAATFSTNLASLLLPANRLRYWCRAVLTLCALALLVVALAKPQWGTETRDIDRSGRDLLLLVDVSISMLAEDATPNRLSVAIGGIRDFVERLRVDGGHRIALLAFAGRASPAAPLTVDYDLFLSRLDDVDTQSTLRRGSHIGDAIRQALYSFGTLDHKYTDIIIISDGEDHGSAPLDAARVAAGLGVSIHTVGIGDSTDGALIPFHSQDGGQYVKVNNTEIISRMQPGLLVELARLTGGRFISVGTGTAALGDFYDDHLASKPTRRIEVLASERKIHRFQWFIALALVLLVLEIVLNRESNSLQKMRQNYRPGSEVLAPVLLIGFTVALLMTYPKGLTANSHEANEFMQQGQRDYERGDFHAAAENFSKATSLLPDSAIGYYNHATARFKLYDYAAAIEHFTIALQSADQSLAGQINYNLGVVKHQQAIGNMMTFQDAMTPLESAIGYYRDSLLQNPNSEDTRFNLELAHSLMQDLIEQRVLPQANAKTRDQKTSDNKGQLHEEDGNRPTEELPDQGHNPEDQKSQNPNGQVSSKEKQNNAQNQSALVQRGEASELKPEDAMQEVELARQRAESMTEQRAQWRQARMENDSVEKFW